MILIISLLLILDKTILGPLVSFKWRNIHPRYIIIGGFLSISIFVAGYGLLVQGMPDSFLLHLINIEQVTWALFSTCTVFYYIGEMIPFLYRKAVEEWEANEADEADEETMEFPMELPTELEFPMEFPIERRNSTPLQDWWKYQK